MNSGADRHLANAATTTEVLAQNHNGTNREDLWGAMLTASNDRETLAFATEKATKARVFETLPRGCLAVVSWPNPTPLTPHSKLTPNLTAQSTPAPA